MKATGKCIENGKTRNWRDIIPNVDEWVENRKFFLKEIWKYDTITESRKGNQIIISAHRENKPRRKEKMTTYILTIID